MVGSWAVVDAFFSMQLELTNGVGGSSWRQSWRFGIWRLESGHQEVFCIKST